MKKFSISIPTPCHEDWSAMTPEGKGRFCSSCQKTVVDFSVMSDRQIAEFFKKPAATSCGRFMPDQLDRVIQTPPKRLPWLRYMLTITIPAFLMSCKLGARQPTQGKAISTEQRLIGDTIAKVIAPPQPTVGMIIERPDTVKGRVSTTKHSKTSSIKRCTIQPIKNDSDVFSKAPFIFHPGVSKIKTTIPLLDEMQGLQGIAGGISFTKISRFKNKAPITLIPQLTATKPSSFLLYPNPVQASYPVTLEWKRIEKGIYQLALQNSAGQMIQQEELSIDNENAGATVQLKSVATGLYFVRLTNKKTGKHFTEKLVVN